MLTIALLWCFGASPPAHAQANDCSSLLEALAENQAVVLQSPDGASLELSIHRFEADSLVWSWRKVSAAGRELAYQVSWSCVDEKLLLRAQLALEPAEPSEYFDPGLTLWAWPMLDTTSWEDSGRFRTEIYGSSSKLPARSQGYLSSNCDGCSETRRLALLELRISEGEDQVKRHLELGLDFSKGVSIWRWRLVDASEGRDETFTRAAPQTAPEGEHKLIIQAPKIEKL
ncbi:MAG: hypothetical protein RBU37_07915 [Myxococcota bacterium]|nr:hypothetical protein [Myxococcota bacterium]